MKKKILWTILVIILISSLLLVGCSSSEEEEEGPRIVELGEYPQTIKAADVTITETVVQNSLYIGSDGAYYALITASPYAVGYKFSDGTVIEAGESYYFKYEPIKWRVLAEESDGTAIVLSEKVLDYQDYYDGAYEIKNGGYYIKSNGSPINTYAYSSIRSFLNGSFYLFSFIEDADIERIQNKSVLSQDKVFLLEQNEAMKVSYGFADKSYTDDPARVKIATDYCRAMGAKILTTEDSYGATEWWLGSKYTVDKDVAANLKTLGFSSESKTEEAACVSGKGDIDGSFALGREGVVPAMRIILP